MNDWMSSSDASPYRCPACSRCFVALGEVAAGELVCACGAPLSPHDLPSGLHELRSPARERVRLAPPCQIPAEQEVDVGYGASHGYDVTHGGPSGPGDAPADVTE